MLFLPLTIQLRCKKQAFRLKQSRLEESRGLGPRACSLHLHVLLFWPRVLVSLLCLLCRNPCVKRWFPSHCPQGTVEVSIPGTFLVAETTVLAV